MNGINNAKMCCERAHTEVTTVFSAPPQEWYEWGLVPLDDTFNTFEELYNYMYSLRMADEKRMSARQWWVKDVAYTAKMYARQLISYENLCDPSLSDVLLLNCIVFLACVLLVTGIRAVFM